MSFLVHSLGFLELQCNRPADALSVFTDGINRYPNNSHILLGAALTEAKLGEIDRARDLFRRAVKADRRHAHAWQAWGVMEAKDKQWATARTLYEQGLKECPDHGALWQAYGMLEVMAEQYDRARLLFQMGLEKCGRTNVQLLQAFACLEVRTGNLDEAQGLIGEVRTCLRACVSMNPAALALLVGQ